MGNGLMRNTAGVTISLCVLAVLVSAPGFADEVYLSPVALAPFGNTVYVAGYTGKKLIAFSAERNEVMWSVDLAGEATGVALDARGEKAYVTGGGVAGRVYVVETSSGSVVGEFTTGHTPTAPVMHPDGAMLFVCNRFENSVSALSVSTGEEQVRIPVTREPDAAAITPDGSVLFVANLLPTGPANANHVGAVVDVIDTNALHAAPPISLPNGSTGVHGVCIAPDGTHAYVTHVLARYQLPTTQLERGWINTNAVSVIDVNAKALVNTFLLDDLDKGAANPWGITCTDDGKWLCVAHAGTHEISVIDRARLHEKLAAAQASGEAGLVPNDLAFIVDIRERVRLKGKAPRALAAVGTRVYATEYFTASLGMIDLAAGTPASAQSLGLAADPAMTMARAGELFFHDATTCFQQWQSCASCHPGDGRVDGLNWDLLNDGLGNPKNNKSLLLAHQTPPAMITGVRETAETAVRAGIRMILFNQHPEATAVTVDEYLKSLTPVPSPRLEDGKLSAAAERGKAVFESACCTKCHPAPLFTDQKQHRVGTGTGREEDQAFDTPTLIELWRTAPYLYDGHAATVRDVVTQYNSGNTHGRTSALTEDAVDDLVVYLLSL